MFAGAYYWLPKWTGVMYSETRGQIHFWWSMISFNITFFPMHFLGLAGMPRRYADYPMQFADFNMPSPVGRGFAFGFAQVYFFFFVVLPAMRGQGCQGPQKPWMAPKAWVGGAFARPSIPLKTRPSWTPRRPASLAEEPGHDHC